MASSFSSIFWVLLLTLMVLCVGCSSYEIIDRLGGRGTMVGGKTEIKDVKNNKQVQDLGRFSVEEHNRKEKLKGEGACTVNFLEVVEGKKQVVSGFKYYLKVDAEENGIGNTFDAIVVVKPWVPSKHLITFTKVCRNKSF